MTHKSNELPLDARRGLAPPQTDAWLNWFPASRVRIVNSTDLYAEPAAFLERVAKFDGVDASSVLDSARGPAKKC